MDLKERLFMEAVKERNQYLYLINHGYNKEIAKSTEIRYQAYRDLIDYCGLEDDFKLYRMTRKVS